MGCHLGLALLVMRVASHLRILLLHSAMVARPYCLGRAVIQVEFGA